MKTVHGAVITPHRAILFLTWFAFQCFGVTSGSSQALKGGQFTVGVTAYPKSLVYYLSHDELSAAMNTLVFDSLLGTDIETNEFIAGLAKTWKVSPDKMTFSFTLDPTATFSDGKPVTAMDVKFTWDTIMDPKNKTAPFQSYFSSIESLEVKDPFTIVFRAKTLHFKNFEKLAGLFILPRHFFSTGDFNKAFHQKLLGSGPYILDSVEAGNRVTFHRNPQYWAREQAQNSGKFNFDRIVFKTTQDPTVAFEIFKRGDTDLHLFNIAKVWSTETSSAPFEKRHVLKLAMVNKIPMGNQGIYWNLRHPLFSDRNVRLLLATLMNRERWIESLFFGSYLPSLGILNLNSEYRSKKNTFVRFDPTRAKRLLKEAGWSTLGTNGILVKKNMPFEFEILTSSPATTRYLTLYQEDLKKMGIRMNIRVQDWPNFLKLLDDRQFDAVTLARTAAIDPSDFGSLWGSEEAMKKGSSNVSGFSDKEVDALAQKIDATFSKKQRIPLVQKIDELITTAQPYALTWEAKETRIAYWNRFSFPGNGYYAYSDWWNAFFYWWVDPKKEDRLQKAKQTGASIEG